MKVCSKCGLSQSLGSFYKDRGEIRSECKLCTLKARAAHYSCNAELIKAKEKHRYDLGGLAKRHAQEQGAPGASVQKCPLCEKMKPLSAFLKKDPTGACRICVNKAYPRDADKQRAKDQRYFNAHRDQIRERGKKYREDNIEVVQARDRARRPQKREYERLYYAARPEKRMVRNATYHRRSLSARGRLTAAQVKARFEVYGGLCAYCGKSADSADHVIPLSRGGSNFPANIRPACTPCNSSKGAKKLSEWKPTLLRAA